VDVTHLQMLSDNYAWLLVDPVTSEAAVVDPSEARPAALALRHGGLTLRWILVTHHHSDHTGGVAALVRDNPGVEVVGSSVEAPRIPGTTRAVANDERIAVAGSEARCLLLPGHTRGAVAFYFAADQALFTGDTMFLAGCGRLFEGTPAEMHASLARIAELPDETRIYCGHEYTEKNLRFALTVEPDNVAVEQRLARAGAALARGEPTVPATLATEKATNPFLRTGEAALQTLCSTRDPVEVFAALRRRRNDF
jgi:hydroxyacylglutathione hydrolase